MAEEDDDDLYDEEFDFVDDDDDDEKDAGEEQASADDSDLADDASDLSDVDAERDGDREQAGGEPAELKEDEYGRTEPVANYVVHLYEAKKFNRTIDRPFTPEDAEAFATEFNRTGKNYGRMAVTGKNDAKPKKSLD